MARTNTCHSLCCNLSIKKNELAEDVLGVFTNDSHTPIPAAFLALTKTSALVQALIFALTPTINSTDKLCQQLIKMYAATVKLLKQNGPKEPGPANNPSRPKI